MITSFKNETINGHDHSLKKTKGTANETRAFHTQRKRCVTIGALFGSWKLHYLNETV